MLVEVDGLLAVVVETDDLDISDDHVTLWFGDGTTLGSSLGRTPGITLARS